MQLGFDRLIKAMDELAPSLSEPVVAQTGKGRYAPLHMRAQESMTPAEFDSHVQQARLIVSHAGIGTILTAARWSKPIALLARRADLNEHRNDHQLATAENLKGRPGILVATEVSDLPRIVAQGLQLGTVAHTGAAQAATLHKAVAKFIDTGSVS
ncbi:MAG: glycosyltransferase [Erythrobacter sp.]|nr:glycosyltransferase [Erythrobacter sp.]